MPPRRKKPLIDLERSLCMPGLSIELEGVPQQKHRPEVGQSLMVGLYEAYCALSGNPMEDDDPHAFVRNHLVVTEIRVQERYVRIRYV